MDTINYNPDALYVFAECRSICHSLNTLAVLKDNPKAFVASLRDNYFVGFLNHSRLFPHVPYDVWKEVLVQIEDSLVQEWILPFRGFFVKFLMENRNSTKYLTYLPSLNSTEISILLKNNAFDISKWDETLLSIMALIEGANGWEKRLFDHIRKTCSGDLRLFFTNNTMDAYTFKRNSATGQLILKSLPVATRRIKDRQNPSGSIILVRKP